MSPRTNGSLQKEHESVSMSIVMGTYRDLASASLWAILS
jgi:hypothetical protein